MREMNGAARSLERIGGIACVGSAVCAVGALIGFLTVVGSRPIGEAATEAAFNVPTVLALVSIILLGVGLAGLYEYQAARATGFGPTGFVVALIGTLLAAGAGWTYVFVLPHFAAEDPALVNVGSGSILAGFLISYVVLAVGWVMFGIATLRAGVFRRGPAWLLIAGAVIAILPMPSRSLVLSVAAAWLGKQLLGAAGDAGGRAEHPI
jgi:hypothetical protein